MKYSIITKFLVFITIVASSGLSFFLPGITNASCHATSISIAPSGTNQWSVTISPCAEWADTRVSFVAGDTLKIEPRSTSTTLQNVRKQFNGDTSRNGTSVSGTTVSTQTQTLKLANVSTSGGIGTAGNEYFTITKIPAGTTPTTPTKPTTPTTPQTPDEPTPDFKNPTGVQYLSGLLTKVIQILLSTIGAVAVIVIVVAGFRLVILGDSESERSKAKKAITWAILGLIFALMSFSIVTIIQRVLQT